MNTEALDTQLARRVIVLLSIFVAAAVPLVLYAVPHPAGGTAPTGLATLNAALNLTASILLSIGFVAIRRGAVKLHRACMLTAFGVSALFLVTYLLHHAQVGSVPFPHTGALRVTYLAILIPHIILAAVILPLALFTIYRGWTGRFAGHKRVARWTLPLWLYVSLSGVVVYFMLYHL
jgi:putative membrane protein